MAVFWDIASCTLVEIDQRFGGTYCLHHQGNHHQTTWLNIPEDSHLHTEEFVPY
jgi:hypothetical protein